LITPGIAQQHLNRPLGGKAALPCPHGVEVIACVLLNTTAAAHAVDPLQHACDDTSMTADGALSGMSLNSCCTSGARE
jgi:hypothetical protein